MIRELSIRGYRCFREFRMADLARVNLLVGTNNCGKTAVLEAIEIASDAGKRPECVWASLGRRGETFPSEGEKAQYAEMDVAHLFHGHQIGLGAYFAVDGVEAQGTPLSVVVAIGRGSREEQDKLPGLEASSDDSLGSRLVLGIETTRPEGSFPLLLTPRGGIPQHLYYGDVKSSPSAVWREGSTTTFVSTDSLSPRAVAVLWESIALTAAEEFVVGALQVLDQSIERVAFVGEASRGRGGLIVKCSGLERPIPIGSLGDGMWRMFCIAASLVRTRGGVVLVDEIDTGLHYSAMEQMWTMVLQAARRLDVQVFATTHSSDCINSLAAASRSDEAWADMVSLQRIEAEHSRAVSYSVPEIRMAARHGIETR